MNTERISTLFKEAGFLESSICSLTESVSFDIYKAQVNSNNIGEMSFLREHLSQKDPKQTKFKTALVGLYPYYPQEDHLGSSFRVALYAKNRDYHIVLKEKLDHLIDQLKITFPDEDFLSATDSKPVLERDLAYRAGLGWVGKNTCILSKQHGSLFFIAEILTTADLNFKENTLQTDHCGNCTKCIDACPTDALTPRKMIVEKCISYRNIESKSYKIDELHKKHENWFFGCDICQTVCPWNEKVHGKESMKSLSKKTLIQALQVSEIKDILTSSNKSLEKKYKDFPFSRARGKRLKRNALFLIYENNITDLISFLESVSFQDELEILRLEILKSLKKAS